MFKLGAIPVIAIAISIAIIILSWGYFWNYQPNVEEAQGLEAEASALHQNAMKAEDAQKRVNNATKMVNDINAQWQAIAAVKTPPPSLAGGGINMAEDPYHLAIDVRTFRNSIQKAVNKQVKVGGVKVINGPTVPSPTDDPSAVVADYFNYPAIPFPVVIFDLGQVTVQGTYTQIMDNMKAWSNMPNYLAVADGLTLNGTSPILTGTYSVSMVGYIRAETVYPNLPTPANVAPALASTKVKAAANGSAPGNPAAPAKPAPKPAAPAAKPAAKSGAAAAKPGAAAAKPAATAAKPANGGRKPGPAAPAGGKA